MREGPPDDARLRGTRTVIAVAVAVLVVAGLAVALAWREYGDAKERAAGDQRARAALAVAIFDTYFAGQVNTLEGIAKAPVVVDGDTAGMAEYFQRVQPPDGTIFTGGIGWIDLQGRNRATSDPAGPPDVSLEERSYFRSVVESGKPFVSEGLTGRVTGHRLLVTSVPTYDASGALSGVLAGSLLFEPQAPGRQALDLGYAGLEILDRDGKSLLAGFTAPRNADLVQRVRNAPPGVLTDTRGLDGSDGRVVAYATSALPGWTVVIDQPRSAIFGTAWRSFLFELALIAGVARAVLAVAAAAIARARRAAQRRSVRDRQHGALVRKLAAASAAVEVADALVAALEGGPDGTRVAVAWASHDRLGVRIAATSADLDALAGDEAAMTEALEVPYASGEPLSLPTEARLHAELPALHAAIGDARSAYAAPLTGADGERVGAVLLLFAARRSLDETVPRPRRGTRRAGRGGARARAGLRARARRRDRACSAASCPRSCRRSTGLDLAGRYSAGGAGLEVGGDWYDVVRRPDGIVHLDRRRRRRPRGQRGDPDGPAAATPSAPTPSTHATRRRRAAAPAAPRRRGRHGDGRLPSRSTRTRASSLRLGGPPAAAAPGRRRRRPSRASTRRSRRRSASSAPRPSARSGSRCRRARRWSRTPTASSSAATHHRRRHRPADVDGRPRRPAPTADALRDGRARRRARRRPRPDDDVALLVVRLLGAPAVLDVEVPARPGEPRAAPPPPARLADRCAASARRSAADTVLAVSEACNNAIEHAYATRAGTVRVVAEHLGATLRIVVEDAGGWRETEPDPERGRGIPIMHGIMERVEIERQPAATRVTLEQRLDGD